MQEKCVYVDYYFLLKLEENMIVIKYNLHKKFIGYGETKLKKKRTMKLSGSKINEI